MPSDQEFLLYPLDTGEDPACLQRFQPIGFALRNQTITL
jgi:hypothetical protein